VLVDGDATYDAPSVDAMIARLLEERLDMVVASRVDHEKAAYRAGHRTGNRLLTAIVAAVFDPTFNDMLSGYRVFLRRFVKSFPLLSVGFEIETELTIHALELGLAVPEIDTPHYARPGGSASKLNTWRDGYRIPRIIIKLYRAERLLAFFTGIGLAPGIVSIGFAIPVFVTYVQTGLVPRLPTAILSTDLMLLAFLSIAVGLVLDMVTRGRREMKLLAYLSHRAPGEEHQRGQSVREIVRTNDAVLVSAIGALLDGAKIPHMVLDQNMSVLEGSLGILPRRVLVADEDVGRARRLLSEAGLANELRPDGR
jgi:hypothetical protein